MVERSPSLLALTNAAARLTRACRAQAASCRPQPLPERPLAGPLRHAFGGGALLPADMINQLGKLK